MKAVKINNPVWIGKLGDSIHKYVKRVSPVGVTHETLYTYFAKLAQFGGDLAEFWVVLDEEKGPQGFAAWFVMDLPHIGTAMFDHFFSWGQPKTVSSMLLTEFVAFMKRKNCVYLKAIPRNDAMIRYIEKKAADFGFEIYDVRNGYIIGGRIK